MRGATFTGSGRSHSTLERGAQFAAPPISLPEKISVILFQILAVRVPCGIVRQEPEDEQQHKE